MKRFASVIAAGILAGSLLMSVASADTAQTCTTKKVAVTKIIKTKTTVKVHGKIVTKTVSRKVVVRVTKNVIVKVKGKRVVVKESVVKYKTVQTCVQIFSPVATTIPAPTTTTIPAPTTTTIPAPTTTTTTTTIPPLTATTSSVNMSYLDLNITAGVAVDTGSLIDTPALNTLTFTIRDTYSGQVLGTWTNTGAYSPLTVQPGLTWTFSEIGSTDLMTLSAQSALYWSGPSVISFPEDDFVNLYIGAAVTYSGQPGYAGSSSTPVVVT